MTEGVGETSGQAAARFQSTLFRLECSAGRFSTFRSLRKSIRNFPDNVPVNLDPGVFTDALVLLRRPRSFPSRSGLNVRCEHVPPLRALRRFPGAIGQAPGGSLPDYKPPWLSVCQVAR